ncbi:hypothetical protein B0H11DRAFT_2424818 [Mycena galericulata]|nr:hypothetical protein B0H11DRAFT_2424818 [Mycena galericulata]
MASIVTVKCRFCGKKVGSSKGLSSHTAQRPACRKKLDEIQAGHWQENHAQRASPTPPPPPHDELAAEGPNEYPEMDLDPPAGDRDAAMPEPARPSRSRPPAASPRGVTIEEVEDEDAPGATRWFENYPLPAGCILERIDPVETVFEAIRQKQKQEGQAPWAPFDSEEDWDLARAGFSLGFTGERADFSRLRLITERSGLVYLLPARNSLAVSQRMEELNALSSERLSPPGFTGLLSRHGLACNSGPATGMGPGDSRCFSIGTHKDPLESVPQCSHGGVGGSKIRIGRTVDGGTAEPAHNGHRGSRARNETRKAILATLSAARITFHHSVATDQTGRITANESEPESVAVDTSP